MREFSSCISGGTLNGGETRRHHRMMEPARGSRRGRSLNKVGEIDDDRGQRNCGYFLPIFISRFTSVSTCSRVRSTALSPDHYNSTNCHSLLAQPLGFTVGPGQSEIRRMHLRSLLCLGDREKPVIVKVFSGPNHCTNLYENRCGCGCEHWCCLGAFPSIPPKGLHSVLLSCLLNGVRPICPYGHCLSHVRLRAYSG
ncbi:hypothetical protein BDW69DRAFT_111534 [Aspergillus filifer]